MSRTDYDERQAARKARYEAKAQKSVVEADGYFKRAKDMASVIPFGQPILVGHHSEGRDRRYRAKIHNTMDKGLEASDKAKHYASKAASVGTGGISSDNPEAIALLREKLAKCEEAQEKMKQANALIRRHKADAAAAVAALVAAGWSESRAYQLLAPDFAGRVGFPSYALQNNNAEIRRIKQRIEQLEAEAARAEELAENPEAGTMKGNGFTITEDAELNRVLCHFDTKPSREVCQYMRREGWRWTPSVGAWSRLLNQRSRNVAKWTAEDLPALLEA